MCRYCETNEDLTTNYYDETCFNIEIYSDELCITCHGEANDYIELKINYCPMCGRKLREEQ